MQTWFYPNLQTGECHQVGKVHGGGFNECKPFQLIFECFIDLNLLIKYEFARFVDKRYVNISCVVPKVGVCEC